MTKAELIAAIAAIDPEADTKDKTNAELETLLEGLQPADEAPAKPPYSIAPGKSVTSKKGLLASGDEIKAEWLAEGDAGETALASLVKSGHVVKA